MAISKEFINFNKEILFGEFGALAGVQAAGYISSHIDPSAIFISYSAVLGAIIGASVFWFFMRVYDKSKKEKYNIDKIAEDLKYITPASAFLTIVCYYPSLFIGTKYLLEHNHHIGFSTAVSQIISFSIFLILINFYRYFLLKFANKKL